MQPGDTLAHYEIRAPLGKGGMGEVFMAHDTKLQRDVALKLLPADISQDADKVARFRREAQLLASLNHPNIAAIYGLEEDAGRVCLVMELARGEDLAKRLARNGPLPLDDALRIAGQLADGLAEAHEKGIVHRDLKPANLMADAEGTVKILDFGLARAFAGDADPENPSTSSSFSPTVAVAMTQPGMVLGTAAYMSPEQARGHTAGKQTDIWAFGCVLFEMLTGRKIFQGATISDSVAAILKNDPPWDALPAGTPAAIRRLLRRCLARDRRQRLHDIGDARLEIDEALRGEPEDAAAEAAATPRSRRALAWPVAATILALAVVGLLVRGSDRGGVDVAGAAPRITGLTQLTDQPGEQIEPSLSPDGKTLAYSSWDGGDKDVFIQRVGGTNPLNLTAGYAGQDVTPAFSPDGERIAFHSDREGGGIFVMGATGETPLRVASRGFDPCWSPDGTAIAYTEEYVVDPYSRIGQSNLWIVTLAGGESRQVYDIDAVDPVWSPSGRRLAFCSHLATVQGQRDIYTIAVEGGEPIAVTEDNPADWNPVWSPDGRWIYFVSDRGGSPDLWRVGIDEATGRTTGEPEAVTAGMTHIASAAISAAGPLAVTAATVSGRIYASAFDPVALTFTGQPTTLLTSAHAFVQLSRSFDGSLIAYRTSAPAEHIYIMNPDGSGRRRLVADEHRNRGPMISPDGRWVVFYSNRSGNYELWAVRVDGTGLRQVTISDGIDFNDPAWLTDGRLFAMTTANGVPYYSEVELPEGGLDALTGAATVVPVAGLDNCYAVFMSPDGRWRSFADMSRGGQVFVQDSESGRRDAVVVDGVAASEPDNVSWLDADRCVIWDTQNRRAIVWNAATRSGRTLADVSARSAFTFADGGRSVIVNETVNGADIWMLTLDH